MREGGEGGRKGRRREEGDLVCHIGFSIILQLCSPVPMITAEFVSSFGTLRRARSRTSVPHEYNTWTSCILISR